MLPRHHPDRIRIAFDAHRLVNNAGLILPSTLAQHLGLPQLLRKRLDLGDAPGRANPGDKISTLVTSALAGGDCIGRTACALGCVVKAPSTLGTFLRSFRWGHVRQLDRVSRELLARAWAAVPTHRAPGSVQNSHGMEIQFCTELNLGVKPSYIPQQSHWLFNYSSNRIFTAHRRKGPDRRRPTKPEHLSARMPSTTGPGPPIASTLDLHRKLPLFQAIFSQSVHSNGL